VSEAILHNLTTIAGEWRALAIVWHAGAALVLAVLILQAATQQLVAVALTLPVFSVAALAWWPFQRRRVSRNRRCFAASRDPIAEFACGGP
jgi:membrane protein implicated in regulation of membrane protease activity